MSHQTGIRANQELRKFIGKCHDGKTRAIKISLENEELHLADTKPVVKDFEYDFDKSVLPLIEENTPCYILYRLDEKSTNGYNWLLLSWVPDTASIRLKMLYASTKSTLKTEFGSSYIKEELHGTVTNELSLSGYKRHKKEFSAPAPLTNREEEIKEMRKSELNTDYGADSRKQTLSGISCPLTDTAQNALVDMRKGKFNYLQFKIELSEEKIHLVKSGNIDLLKLPKEVPENEARYHLFLFKHTHEGDYLESFVFIYSMPGYSCSVKERMMYSSCKAPFLDVIEQLGIEVIKKLEIDVGSELTEEFLQDELHPKKILHRPQFAKPKGPLGRGPKRLTKPQSD